MNKNRHDEKLLARLVREAGDPSVSPDPHHTESLRTMLLDHLDPATPTDEVTERIGVEKAIPLIEKRSQTMKHIVKLAIAATILVALGIFTSWTVIDRGSSNLAFADFVKPILEAKSAKCKVTFERDGKQVATANCMILAPNRTRVELQRPDEPMELSICDYSKGVYLTLDSGKKIAVVNKMVGLSQERMSMNLLEEIRSLLLDADKPDVKRESLGGKKIDGRRVVGWRLSGLGLHEPGVVVTVWGDPQTGLPISFESFYSLTNQKSVMSDFILNPVLDESMFSLDIPAGYEVINTQTDLSLVTEKDIIETLRRCGKVFGTFPETLDMKAIYKAGEQLPTKDQHQIDDLVLIAMRGFGFVEELPLEADMHYAGKGVSFGATDTPIFWYQPRDSKTYHVIYADLSVKEMTPEEVQKFPEEPKEKTQ